MSLRLMYAAHKGYVLLSYALLKPVCPPASTVRLCYVLLMAHGLLPGMACSWLPALLLAKCLATGMDGTGPYCEIKAWKKGLTAGGRMTYSRPAGGQHGGVHLVAACLLAGMLAALLIAVGQAGGGLIAACEGER